MPEQRVLATKVDKTVEDMVRRMERELNKELAFLRLKMALEATEAGPAPTVAQPDGVSVQRLLPAAATKLETLNIENIQFSNSFVAIEAPQVPPGPPTTNLKVWMLIELVEEQPKGGQKPDINNKHGAIELTTRRLPSGKTKQRPSDIELGVCPQPDQD